jgi:hypothetical protein
MNSIWIGVLFLAVLVVLVSRPTTETMQSMPMSVASQAVSELTTGKLKVGAKSVERIAITEASLVASQPGIASRLFGNAPSHTVVLKARPKYYMNGGAIVALGKRFEVRGYGNSTHDADGMARRQAAAVLANVQSSLQMQNLMM